MELNEYPKYIALGDSYVIVDSKEEEELLIDKETSELENKNKELEESLKEMDLDLKELKNVEVNVELTKVEENGPENTKRSNKKVRNNSGNNSI